MKTMPVRISLELKERLENAIRQYRHKTGENITISECINKLLTEPEFRQLTGWNNRTPEQL